jgi:hypothetical protein
MATAPKVDLFTICRGAAHPLFQNALDAVNANIKDPNTGIQKKRKITLSFEFTPYKDRSGAAVLCSVDTKLAGVTGVDSTIYLKKTDGVVEAFTQDTSQIDLFEGETEEQQKEKV